MPEEPTFHQKLYSTIYNGKSISVPVGYRKLRTIFKNDNNSLASKYHSKDDQNCVFGSMTSSFSATKNSLVEEGTYQ